MGHIRNAARRVSSSAAAVAHRSNSRVAFGAVVAPSEQEWNELDEPAARMQARALGWPEDVYMNNVHPDSEEHRRIPPVNRPEAVPMPPSYTELVRNIRVRGNRVREISRELQAGVNPSARLSLMEELSQLRVQNDSDQIVLSNISPPDNSDLSRADDASSILAQHDDNELLEVLERNSRELERDSLMSNASSNNTAIDMDREELFGPEDESLMDVVD